MIKETAMNGTFGWQKSDKHVSILILVQPNRLAFCVKRAIGTT